jgi:tetratricopeptide (TPR) repeat protein
VLRDPSAEALTNQGAALFELKRFEQALANYERALAVRPTDREALDNSGSTIHELKRCSEALSRFDRVLAVYPGHPDAFYIRDGSLVSPMWRGGAEGFWTAQPAQFRSFGGMGR